MSRFIHLPLLLVFALLFSFTLAEAARSVPAPAGQSAPDSPGQWPADLGGDDLSLALPLLWYMVLPEMPLAEEVGGADPADWYEIVANHNNSLVFEQGVRIVVRPWLDLELWQWKGSNAPERIDVGRRLPDGTIAIDRTLLTPSGISQLDQRPLRYYIRISAASATPYQVAVSYPGTTLATSPINAPPASFLPDTRTGEGLTTVSVDNDPADDETIIENEFFGPDLTTATNLDQDGDPDAIRVGTADSVQVVGAYNVDDDPDEMEIVVEEPALSDRLPAVLELDNDAPDPADFDLIRVGTRSVDGRAGGATVEDAADVDDDPSEVEIIVLDPDLAPRDSFGVDLDGADPDVIVVGTISATVAGIGNIDADVGDVEIIVAEPGRGFEDSAGVRLGTGDEVIVLVGTAEEAKIRRMTDVDGDASDREVIVTDPALALGQSDGVDVDGDSRPDIFRIGVDGGEDGIATLRDAAPIDNSLQDMELILEDPTLTAGESTGLDLDGDGDDDVLRVETKTGGESRGAENVDQDAAEEELLFADPALDPGSSTALNLDEDTDFDLVRLGTQGSGWLWGSAHVDNDFLEAEFLLGNPQMAVGTATPIDLDADGDFDVIVFGGDPSHQLVVQPINLDSDPQEREIVITDPTLAPATTIDVDLDADGDFDLLYVSADQDVAPGAIQVDTGQVDFLLDEYWVAVGEPGLPLDESFAVDVDEDGDTEIYWIGTENGVSVIPNRPLGDVPLEPEIIAQDPSIAPSDSHSLDLKGDGNPDVFVIGGDRVGPSFPGLFNNDNDFETDIAVPTDEAEEAPAGWDLDSDGDQDALTFSAHEGSTVMAVPAESFGSPWSGSVVVTSGPPPSAVVNTYDVDEDGYPELVSVPADPPLIRPEPVNVNNDNGENEVEIIFTNPARPPGEITFTDIDDDGDGDVLEVGTQGIGDIQASFSVQNVDNDPVEVELVFEIPESEQLLLQLPEIDAPFLTVDVDEDGDMDVLFAAVPTTGAQADVKVYLPTVTR